MADLSSYDGLQAAIGDWLNRADLVEQIPVFIRLAEVGLNRELRVRQMQVRAQAISQLEFVPLPFDFLQEYSLQLNPAAQPAQPPLAYVGKKTADEIKAAQRSGQVSWYTLIDNAFELIPSPQANVDLIMIYYGRIPALGMPAGTPRAPLQSNWLLEKAPDLYLASSLLQAAPYLNDAGRLQTWAQLRAEIMASMFLEDERAMRSTTQLTARARAF